MTARFSVLLSLGVYVSSVWGFYQAVGLPPASLRAMPPDRANKVRTKGCEDWAPACKSGCKSLIRRM